MEKVLIMEPSVVLRSQWKRSLNQAGYSVVEAAARSQVYGRLITENVDLIILGMGSVQDADLELIKLLKNSPLYSDIPVMVAAEDQRRTSVEQVLKLRIIDYLLKPFPTSKLARRVQQVAQQLNYA